MCHADTAGTLTLQEFMLDEFGFDAFKWRVGAECGNEIDEWPGRTEEVVPVVVDTSIGLSNRPTTSQVLLFV